MYYEKMNDWDRKDLDDDCSCKGHKESPVKKHRCDQDEDRGGCRKKEYLGRSVNVCKYYRVCERHKCFEAEKNDRQRKDDCDCDLW